MKRAVWSAAVEFRKACPRPMFFCAMLTLTYRPGCCWRRRHVSECLRVLRRSLPAGVVLRYVWVMELTAAGVPHYHVLVWLPVGVLLPKPDRCGAWPHGMSRIEASYAPVGYLMKYATKGDDVAAFPKGARIYGCGGLEREQRAVVRWWLLPRYIRELVTVGDHVVRCRGVGGWVSVLTGQWWPPWKPPLEVLDGSGEEDWVAGESDAGDECGGDCSEASA